MTAYLNCDSGFGRSVEPPGRMILSSLMTMFSHLSGDGQTVAGWMENGRPVKAFHGSVADAQRLAFQPGVSMGGIR